ncbi:hypothetical protein Bbelb_397830 [Branchiostoma belcheri]|nr:hypothetical protein Bbelb_397830 [Branchiostoma belcheri]
MAEIFNTFFHKVIEDLYKSLSGALSPFSPVQFVKKATSTFTFSPITVEFVTEQLTVWDQGTKGGIDKLQKLQNRAGRVILGCDHYTPSDTILHRLGWTPVIEMHKRNKAVLVYKALHEMSPPHISDLYNSMDKVQPGVLIFLLVILKVFGPTEAPCSTERYCQCNRLKLTSIPQDLPRHGDILVCEASGIPTPDITVTLPSGLNKTVQSSGLNKTVQSGGRVTVGANGTIIINVTADAAGLYVCTATNPVGSTFASLFVYARQENPKTLEPGLEKPTNLTLEPQLDTLRKLTFEPELDQPTSLTLEPARKPESSNGPTDSNSNDCTATDNTDNVTANQDQTVLAATPVQQCDVNQSEFPEEELYNSMGKVQTGVLIFLLVILKVFGPTEAPCVTDYVCKYDNQRLTSVPQDLPTPHHVSDLSLTKIGLLL